MKSLSSRAIALALFALLAAPLSATAQVDDERPPGFEGEEDGRDYFAEPDQPSDPMRLLLLPGGGFQVRIVEDLDFRQSRFGPAYLEAWGALVLPGRGLRHAFGVGIGTNLSGDGDATIGVDPVGNLAFSLGYMPYIRFGDSWVLLPKAAVLFAIGDSIAMGGEVTVAGSYLFLAGFGIYAEVGVAGWAGGPACAECSGSLSFHPMLSIEAGLIFDYEVLP